MRVKFISISLISFIVILVGAYATFLIYNSWPINELSISNAGLFGDSFGIVTSLFSGLAFTGMIVTILLQREELRLQRKELQLTRKEFIEQKKYLNSSRLMTHFIAYWTLERKTSMKLPS